MHHEFLTLNSWRTFDTGKSETRGEEQPHPVDQKRIREESSTYNIK